MSSFYELVTKNIDREKQLVQSVYRPTIHAQGAWNGEDQHMGPVSGLLAAEIEQFFPRSDMRLARISYDIFGRMYRDECTVRVRMIRPGRTIELVEAQMEIRGRICVVARAWRMMTQDSSEIAALEDQAVVGPHELSQPWVGQEGWLGGFIQSLEAVQSSAHRPGQGLVWLNTDKVLVAGHKDSDFAHLMCLVDMANGVAHRQSDTGLRWSFPNLDLQIHMYRQPVGRWLGIEATQQYGTDGIGLSSAILHDEQGPFGRSEQILTVRPLPQSEDKTG